LLSIALNRGAFPFPGVSGKPMPKSFADADFLFSWMVAISPPEVRRVGSGGTATLTKDGFAVASYATIFFEDSQFSVPHAV
jgi:hypothetical protein